MRFAQSTFLYFNHSLPDAIRSLHRCGYQGVEIWGGRPHMYRRDLDGECDRIRGLLDTYGMTVPNFIPAQFRYPTILGSANEAVRRDSVAYIMSAMDNALRIGAPSISLCAGMTLAGEPVEIGWRQLSQSIRELLDYHPARNLRLLLEPAHRWESTMILTVDDGLRMVREIGSERVGICLDTGHLHVNGEDFAANIAKLAHLPLHVQLDDNRGDSDAHMIPGEGTIDFASVARALQGIGYQGFISAELGFQYTLEPEAAAGRAMTALRRIFA